MIGAKIERKLHVVTDKGSGGLKEPTSQPFIPKVDEGIK